MYVYYLVAVERYQGQQLAHHPRWIRRILHTIAQFLTIIAMEYAILLMLLL